MTKAPKKAAKKRGRKKITRKVQYRFPGIDRGLSKAVYGLESRLALAQRELKAAVKRTGSASRIQNAFNALSAKSRRKLLEHAAMLLAVQKKG